MRTKVNTFLLLSAICLCFIHCRSDNNSNSQDNSQENTIMEVTSFKINANANPADFAKQDAQVEQDFTSKQPGFIKRQSGVDEEGNYVVIVYWESIANAEASINLFMTDASVADYAQMIDASTMNIARYTMDKAFDANNSQFVEVMSYDLKPNIDKTAFNALNQKVETDFTSKREGFLQRLTGEDEAGKQIIAVYWTSKATSDASLQPFMDAPISQQFMEMIDPSSINMKRYSFLDTTL